VDGLNVDYTSPSQGHVEFSWYGAFKVAGQIVPLHAYPRFANPYCQAGFNQSAFTIERDGEILNLNFQG